MMANCIPPPTWRKTEKSVLVLKQLSRQVEGVFETAGSRNFYNRPHAPDYGRQPEGAAAYDHK